MEVGLKSVCSHFFTKAADQPSESASTETKLLLRKNVRVRHLFKYILRYYYAAKSGEKYITLHTWNVINAFLTLTWGLTPTNPTHQQEVSVTHFLPAHDHLVLKEWGVSWACVDRRRKGNAERLFVIVTMMTYMERSMWGTSCFRNSREGRWKNMEVMDNGRENMANPKICIYMQMKQHHYSE